MKDCIKQRHTCPFCRTEFDVTFVIDDMVYRALGGGFGKLVGCPECDRVCIATLLNLPHAPIVSGQELDPRRKRPL